MKYIKFHPHEYIILQAKKGASVQNAVAEAILFCHKHSLLELELQYNGFLFTIEPNSNLRELLKEYNHYLIYKQEERDKACKCKSLEFVTYKIINANE